jgi:hypothetical protein
MLIYSRALRVDHLLRRKYLQPTPNYHAYQIFHSEHILRMHNRRHTAPFLSNLYTPSHVVVFNCIRHPRCASPIRKEVFLHVAVLGPAVSFFFFLHGRRHLIVLVAFFERQRGVTGIGDLGRNLWGCNTRIGN